MSAIKVTGTKKNNTAKTKTFPIVGIGASAGGLEAIEGLFGNMPSDSGMAFVIIQHLDPKRTSIMGSLLQKFTKMIILEAEDGMKIEPNRIYLNPPKKDVGIINRTLQLVEPSESRGIRLPIDAFLRSLAVDQKERAICIILSGTGTDGTLGLKAIKGEGGITIAQEQQQAKYAGMPGSAIDTGLVDFILPVEKISSELLKYVKHPYIEGKPIPVTAPEQYKNYLAKIFMLIRSATGHDYSNYKQTTIRRRIERRMALHQISKLENYFRYMQQNDAEVEIMAKDMLISVTGFFREPDAFALLKEKVLPALLNKSAPDLPLRIWVPGCATGEEAYSLAMLIAEALEKSKSQCQVQIFATDIDKDAIETARAASYPESIAADVSQERLRRFFIKEDSILKVKKQIREMVIFADQDLIKDPPFSKLDLISCRNVLIYMNQALQKKIIPLFHYVLNPDGYLFLGSSETVGEFGSLFISLNPKLKIFKRKGVPVARGAEMPRMPFIEKGVEVQMEGGRKVLTPVSVSELAKKTILDKYGPPCVILNEKSDILYFHGNTSRYLVPPSGEPVFNIIKMAHEDIRYKLSTMIRSAFKQKKTVVSEDVPVKINGGYRTVRITAVPLKEQATFQDLMMVVFEDLISLPKKGKTKEAKLPKTPRIDTRIQTLERELQSTREYLQSTVEQLETSNEELKSANEELQATNEELQSMNEEMETSREELQSMNEELVTVNSELQDKVNELSKTNNDMHNMLSSTDLGFIFLDSAFCIRRFTPPVTIFFSLRITDIGRPISEITSTILDQDINSLAEDVLSTLHKKEIEIQTKDGGSYVMTVLPYRTVENVIDGVVLTFVDFTDRKKAEVALRESEEHFRALVKASSDVVYQMSPDWTEMRRLVGKDFIPDTDTPSQVWLQKYIHPKDQEHVMAVIQEAIRNKAVFELEHQVLRRDGTLGWTFSRALPILDGKGEIIEWYGMASDVPERKRLESMKRLATVVQDSNDAITVQDFEGKILAWNRGAEKMYGWTEAEALAMNIAETMPPGKSDEALAYIDMINKGQVVESYETRRRTKDGRIMDVWMTITVLLDNKGNKVAVATTERDITGRMRSEKRIKELEAEIEDLKKTKG